MANKLSYLKRASLTLHPIAQRLFKMMEDKKSNLALTLDVSSQGQLLEMADELGPDLCIVKTHVDILEDYTPDFGEKLKKIAQKHQFLIFEDRKFCDIGQTVAYQYTKGIYRISEWADIVNAHAVPGPGVIQGLKKEGKGIFLIAEMTSEGTLAKGAYSRKAVLMGESYPESVIGFISLRKLSDNPGMIHFTPGVKLKKGKDSLGQRHRSVEEILIKNQSDIISVGRGITHAKSPREEAKIYRERGWAAYEKSVR